MNYIIVDTYKELSKKAANIIVSQVTLKPNCVLGLATGSTPLGTYSNMVEKYNAGDVDFSKVTSFNLDEYVGLDSLHNQSYRYFMNENLFSKINIKKEKTFVPNGMAENLIEEGKEYDRLIESFGGIDLQLLGIGIDGHIGFNEPDKVFTAETHIAELDDSTIKANSRFFNSEKDVPKQAITMGMKSIMRAKKILLVANGKGKKDILEKAIYGPIDPMIPASILQLHPDVTVIFSKE
ncbi:MAG: glucosamine-6-phosphate deaminase [Clostridia bacterium]|nr:glucosamine-6-phosphate deaminase [Clostridia bacterium]